ncbi:hypothetical protein CVT24_000916 [Panaeolus cyanescens]|uniref:Uncharacterized protein n=1 Tax=Panaeolus cyanescens TaxID=181874 RepID=A0A409WBJ8_9AGAR|nr:hypothetical protein CVT24_000916 [Panaeolus cyanescens]
MNLILILLAIPPKIGPPPIPPFLLATPVSKKGPVVEKCSKTHRILVDLPKSDSLPSSKPPCAPSILLVRLLSALFDLLSLPSSLPNPQRTSFSFKREMRGEDAKESLRERIEKGGEAGLQVPVVGDIVTERFLSQVHQTFHILTTSSSHSPFSLATSSSSLFPFPFALAKHEKQYFLKSWDSDLVAVVEDEVEGIDVGGIGDGNNVAL